jgi:4-amino-4-deoxy-L-arabinose transferase-like glycosyltransferase
VKREHRVLLAVVLTVALALRVAAALNGLEVRPGSDTDIYERLAARLYEDGAYGIPGSANPYDFAPGPPLFAAAVYTLTGTVSPVAARLAVAVAGTLAVLMVFLIARRLAGPGAGLVGAALAAVYPVPIYYTGKLVGEPIAMLTVAAAILAFLRAGDPGRRVWAWALPGALFGVTAYLRPEYLGLAALFALVALSVVWRRSGPGRGLAAGAVLAVAFGLVVAPWAMYVSGELGRFVPVSTGGGKALFIGTYLPGDGLHDGVKRDLLRRFRGEDDVPLERLREIPMNPLLDRVARRYPELPRDSALQRVGRRNLVRYTTDRPLAFAGMVAAKIGHMWQGSGNASRTLAGSAYHYAMLALGLLGLAILAGRRRWEAIPLAVLLVGISLMGGVLLAGTRRNVPVMPVVLALAGMGAVAVAAWARDRMRRPRYAAAGRTSDLRL